MILAHKAAMNNPNSWFGERYPEVVKQAGSPFDWKPDEAQRWTGKSFSEDFFALILGEYVFNQLKTKVPSGGFSEAKLLAAQFRREVAPELKTILTTLIEPNP